MKALTLHQPWAHLVAQGIKTLETRSWKTNYRGHLAIHAAADYRTVEADSVLLASNTKAPLYRMPWDRYLPDNWGDLYGELNFGLIVAVVRVKNCVPADAAEYHLQRVMAGDKDAGARQWASEQLFFGDFSEDRWVWEFDHIIEVGRWVPARGKQGLWTLTPAEELLLATALQADGVDMFNTMKLLEAA